MLLDGFEGLGGLNRVDKVRGRWGWGPGFLWGDEAGSLTLGLWGLELQVMQSLTV